MPNTPSKAHEPITGSSTPFVLTGPSDPVQTLVGSPFTLIPTSFRPALLEYLPKPPSTVALWQNVRNTEKKNPKIRMKITHHTRVHHLCTSSPPSPHLKQGYCLRCPRKAWVEEPLSLARRDSHPSLLLSSGERRSVGLRSAMGSAFELPVIRMRLVPSFLGFWAFKS